MSDNDGLPRYKPEAICPKCAGDDVATFYCEAGRCVSHCPACWVEHMHRGCTRCGYGWLERPLRLDDPSPRTPGRTMADEIASPGETPTGPASVPGARVRRAPGEPGPVGTTEGDA